MLKFQFPKMYTKYAFPCSICANVAADEKECLTCPALVRIKNEDEFIKEIEAFVNGRIKA